MFLLHCWNATPSIASLARSLPALLPIVTGHGCQAAAAVPMRFERLGLDDGLSQQAVLGIAQDAQGFMWFGTEDGLDRFDGYSFQHLRQPHAVRGLPDAFLTDVQAAAAGRLWLGTDGGGAVWRGAGEQEFHSVLTGVPESAARGLESLHVIHLDRIGQLW